MNYAHPYRPTAPEEHNPNLPQASQHTWEYKRLTRNLKYASPPSEADLNEYGKEGWEFISSLVYAETLYLYFKRPSK